MGIRKFPNPRFNLEQWRKLNGGDLSTWKGFEAEVKPDVFHSKLRDGSIEPPFYFGMSCGACHIAFDPLNPPKDPNNPKPENIKGLVGNQYTNVTAIMSSGEATNSPMFRVFNYVRSGTVDTSGFPHDFNGNPGTPNAIFNLNERPAFPMRKSRSGSGPTAVRRAPTKKPAGANRDATISAGNGGRKKPPTPWTRTIRSGISSRAGKTA